MEQHTVEVSFDGELVSFRAGESGDLTLYRRPDGTYFVYLDARKVGDNAVLEQGHHPRGFSEREIWLSWPQLLQAHSGQ